MGPCYERMLYEHEYTPEKGAAQLKRMKACYDRELRFKAIGVGICLVLFVLVFGFVGIVAVIR